jgi:cytochrome c biogenesis protein CcmG, thiol:disulfide interchange protein DsbE
MGDLAFFLMALGMVVLGIGIIVGVLRTSEGGRPKGVLAWTSVALGTLFSVTGVLFAILGAFVQPMYEPEAIRPTDEEFGQVAEDFAFRRVSDDREISLSELRGRVVLLNVWATWCPPCVYELPELNRLQDVYGSRGLMVVTISDERRNRIVEFEQRLPLRTLSAYTSSPGALPDPFRRGFRTRPSTFILDREGRIQDFLLGARTFEEFERAIEPYLYEESEQT